MQELGSACEISVYLPHGCAAGNDNDAIQCSACVGIRTPVGCVLQITSACHCGKLSRAVRCSQSSFSCGKLCGQRLPCGHRCPHKCHPGDCPACSLTATVTCHCGADTKTLPCRQSDFHCDRVCGKRLSCGRHTCEEVCHGGPCPGCPMEGPRLCPCGKVCVPVPADCMTHVKPVL